MQNRIRSLLAVIAAFFRKIGQAIGKVFYKICPRREAKYFDAESHERKYIGLMALSAVAIYLFMTVALRTITKEDMKLIPGGEKLAKLLHMR